MSRIPRGPNERTGFLQIRDILFILAALAVAALTVMLIVQAMRTPAPFFGMT